MAILDVKYFAKRTNVCEVVEVLVPQTPSPKSFDKIKTSDVVSVDLARSQEVSS